MKSLKACSGHIKSVVEHPFIHGEVIHLIAGWIHHGGMHDSLGECLTRVPDDLERTWSSSDSMESFDGIQYQVAQFMDAIKIDNEKRGEPSFDEARNQG